MTLGVDSRQCPWVGCDPWWIIVDGPRIYCW